MELEKEMSETKIISVYGSGCKNCHTLFENAQKAVAELGIDAQVDYVTDIVEISTKGIISTPAMAFDGKVVSMGKVLDVNAIAKLLLQEKSAAADDASASSCSCGSNCC